MIEAIAIAIAVLGAVLLLILFARIRAVDAELKLKKHRAKDAAWPICSITPPWSMTA